jgi:hypothetical protein
MSAVAAGGLSNGTGALSMSPHLRALSLNNNSSSRRPSIASSISSHSGALSSNHGGGIAVVPALTGFARVDSLLARCNAWLRRFTPLQVVLSFLILVHLRDNLSLLLGLNAPHHSIVMEPDMHYSRNFATVRWLLTSLDAATLSVLKVKIAPLRHGLMLLLSVYYLLNFRRAENKVEAFRRSMSHEAIRACWEKGSTPVLAAVDRLMRPRCIVELELVSVRSPDGHDIECRLFYNKPRTSLAQEKAMMLHYPGGGFIAMSPQHHADYLSFWARTLEVPILSVNYRKAPEHPFPCGFEDAWVSVCSHLFAHEPLQRRRGCLMVALSSHD